MTEAQEQKRILIAEACGWKWEPDSQTFLHTENGRVKNQYFPDYFGSLDAMREAEKILTSEQWGQYIRVLHDVCKSPMWGDRHVIGASAAEKADAFGLALGLWKEAA